MPVVVAAAPAGYGKTTLLAAWARRDPRPFHWLTCGCGDIARRRWLSQLAQLAAEAEHVRAPAVVVLDGLDGPDAESDRLVAEIAGALPPGVAVVVACRSAAGLRLGRLRAQSDVLEVGRADLALTTGEAAALLDAHGVGLPRAELASLMAVTEGWPALMALVAGVLADEDDLRATAADVALRHPHVVEYVRDEVLAPLPAELAAFLRDGAVLDELDAELCTAVLDDVAAAGHLAEVERSALPVVRPQRTSPRVRLHPVVRAVLLAELERTRPGVPRRLHRRASAWFAAHDELDVAMRHAVAGGDHGAAGELLWRVAQRSAFDGRRGQVERWLRELPDAVVQAHEGLALSGALLALSRRDPATAARLLAAARSAAAEARTPRASAGRLVLEAALEHDDVAAMRRVATAAAQRSPEHEPEHALALFVGGVAAAIGGDERAATRSLEAAARRATAVAPGLASLCQAQLALMALCRGDWEHGATLAERARGRADAVGLADHGLLALTAAVAAFARAHRGRYAEARAEADLAMQLAGARDELPAWYSAELDLALARARLRLSEVTEARALLVDARRAAGQLRGAKGLAVWLADADAHLHAAGSACLAPGALLTPAELRVLACLPSHLSFREIGTCLHVSANTVKSQAHAVYRKLDASSRSAAVARATALGLLEDQPHHQPPRRT